MEPRCQEPGTSTCELRAGEGTWDKARADCAGTWQAPLTRPEYPASDGVYPGVTSGGFPRLKMYRWTIGRFAIFTLGSL
jgi:hypothetical protein